VGSVKPYRGPKGGAVTVPVLMVCIGVPLPPVAVPAKLAGRIS